jgi:hypothetical protein
VATWLGMKAPPASYWTIAPGNPLRVSAFSRDGNPPLAASAIITAATAVTSSSALPTIEEEDEELVAAVASSAVSPATTRHVSVDLSFCSSLRPSAKGSINAPLVDPLFNMLWAKVQTPVGEESDQDSDDCDDDDDDDDDDDSCSFSFSLSAFLKDVSDPVGVEQALDSSLPLSSSLRPAPLSIRKTVVEVPPVAHPEPLRGQVTYPEGAARKLHPALKTLCAHLNA